MLAEITDRVTDRTIVLEGPIVEINIPAKASFHEIAVDGKPLSYLMFIRNVPGGFINCFVHTKDEMLAGTTITARAKLWQKRMSNGVRYHYIDFEPSDEPATHRLLVVSKKSVVVKDDWTVIDTIMPLRGIIAFAPPDALIESPNAAAPVGDLQLDRLLAQGWAIKEQGELVVILQKPGKKDLVHHRPKKR